MVMPWYGWHHEPVTNARSLRLGPGAVFVSGSRLTDAVTAGAGGAAAGAAAGGAAGAGAAVGAGADCAAGAGADCGVAPETGGVAVAGADGTVATDAVGAGVFAAYHHAPAAAASTTTNPAAASSGVLERRGGGKAEERTGAAPGWPIALMAPTSGSRYCSIGDFQASTHCAEEM